MSEKINVDYSAIAAERQARELENTRLKNEARARKLARRVIKSAAKGKTNIRARRNPLLSTYGDDEQSVIEPHLNALISEDGLSVDLYDEYLGLGDYETRIKIKPTKDIASDNNVIPISKNER